MKTSFAILSSVAGLTLIAAAYAHDEPSEGKKTDQIIVTQKIYSELQENPSLNWKITKLQSKSQRQ